VDDLRRLSSGIARVFMGILGAICLAIGSRVAYTSYLSEKVFQECLSGSSCSVNLNSLGLQSAYSSAQGELILGAGLAVLGVLVLMYSFLFAGTLNNSPLIPNKS